jgi:hypothetical protein
MAGVARAGAAAGAGAAASAGREGLLACGALGTGRTARFFFGATRRAAGFFLASFFLTCAVFLRVADFSAAAFFCFTLAFAFFLAAMTSLLRVSRSDKENKS